MITDVLVIFWGNVSPLARETKAKINKWDYIKTKKLLHGKGNYQQNKRPPTEWEKIFVYNIPDEGVISKLYKGLIQLNIKNKLKNGGRPE